MFCTCGLHHHHTSIRDVGLAGILQGSSEFTVMAPDRLTRKTHLFKSLDRLSEDDVDVEETHCQSMLSLYPSSTHVARHREGVQGPPEITETRGLRGNDLNEVPHTSSLDPRPDRGGEDQRQPRRSETNHAQGRSIESSLRVKETPLGSRQQIRSARHTPHRPPCSPASSRGRAPLSSVVPSSMAPSGSKRKRDAPIKLRPEEQQIFKGLTFCKQLTSASHTHVPFDLMPRINSCPPAADQTLYSLLPQQRHQQYSQVPRPEGCRIRCNLGPRLG